MKRINFFIFILILITCTAVSAQNKSWQISVTNTHPFTVTDAFISVDLPDDILTAVKRGKFIIRYNDVIIPSQLINDQINGRLIFVTDVSAGEKKIYDLLSGEELDVPEYKNRTYAELSMKPVEKYNGKIFEGQFQKVTSIKVPSIHTDHDALFKYEGPGWESEKVGYRFYLDWRNANDIFGKKVNELVLEGVGINDTIAKDDSYHNMQEWGMDIFKVGNTLGLGSIGMEVNDSIYMVSDTDSIYFNLLTNGPLISAFTTSYYGWKAGESRYNLTSELSIAAGSRLTKCSIGIKGNAPHITSGLAKFQGTEFFKGEEEGEWSYIALYGKQSLSSPDDQLGIAVLYRNSDLLKQSEDKLNYFVNLKASTSNTDYFFCAAWDKEPDGIKNKEEFRQYLNKTISILNNPLLLEILP
jgi:hypothetical protein